MLECAGAYELLPNLYKDVTEGKFKIAGQLTASSVVINSTAPNFMASWVYCYIPYGLDSAL